MTDDDRKHLQEMLRIHKENLQTLEKQEASLDSYVPPHIVAAIKDKRRQIHDIERQLSRSRTATTLNDLPRLPVIFVGREKEIAQCLEALAPEERSWGVIIDGIGGMGKTTLALQVAHLAREQNMFEGYLFCSAKTTYLSPDGIGDETGTVQSLDGFIRKFAHRLGVDHIDDLAEASDRREALVDALRERRVLLVWDNLETFSPQERNIVTAFLRNLPGQNKAIVTSRRRTGDTATVIRLDQLSEEEAFHQIELFAQSRPQLKKALGRADESVKRAIYEAAGGNPLAIKWTLELVDRKGYTLDGAVEHLRNADRNSDLYRYLFASAASELTPNDKKLLAALATFDEPVTSNALAELSGLGSNERAIALERLIGCSLVNEASETTFTLHPLTKAYVRKEIGAPVPNKKAARLVRSGMFPRIASSKPLRRRWLLTALALLVVGTGGVFAWNTAAGIMTNRPTATIQAAQPSIAATRFIAASNPKATNTPQPTARPTRTLQATTAAITTSRPTDPPTSTIVPASPTTRPTDKIVVAEAPTATQRKVVPTAIPPTKVIPKVVPTAVPPTDIPPTDIPPTNTSVPVATEVRQPFEGEWYGTTNNGDQISFIVSNHRVTSISFTFGSNKCSEAIPEQTISQSGISLVIDPLTDNFGWYPYGLSTPSKFYLSADLGIEGAYGSWNCANIAQGSWSGGRK